MFSSFKRDLARCIKSSLGIAIVCSAWVALPIRRCASSQALSLVRRFSRARRGGCKRGTGRGGSNPHMVPAKSKRQGSSNSFAFIHRLIRQTEKLVHDLRLSGITAINKLQLLDVTAYSLICTPGHTWSLDVTGRDRGQIWSHLITGCHRPWERSNMVTHDHWMSGGHRGSIWSHLVTGCQRRSQNLFWSNVVKWVHRSLKCSQLAKGGNKGSERYYGQIWSKEVTGGHRGLIWSHLVIESQGHWQRSNMVTTGNRRSQAVKEV